MSDGTLALLLAAEKSIAEEGRDIIIAMLVVGLVFLSVIALGQLGRWLSHRRRGH
ncbi:MAG TPA: hypothetical protein VHF23_00830 [Gaiellaceae bacterium]|nr:hypothetical protein [Gaiellaceae bacterium]